MNKRQKIMLAVITCLAVAGLVLLLFLPSNSKMRDIDFYITDTNGNNQMEVNEPIRFIVNDSISLEGKRVLWKMGNGDSIVGHPNIVYKYRNAGQYLVTLHVDGQQVRGKTIVVLAVKENVAVDSIPKINGVVRGYQGEDLVFSAEGHGMDTWYWEFGESGTVDAFDRQVVYRYEKPGNYIIRLKTNTTQYPVEHEITILPKVEDIIEQPQEADTTAIIQNDIKRRLQAIANAKAGDKSVFYTNMNYIKNNYFSTDASQVVVEVNGDRYNVFPDYCQGLHYLESRNRVIIEDVKVDDIKHITKIQVTQRYIRK